MDARIFDDLTRLFGNRRSRRRALQLALLPFALLVPPTSTVAACRAGGRRCSRNNECCSKRCSRRGRCTTPPRRPTSAPGGSCDSNLKLRQCPSPDGILSNCHECCGDADCASINGKCGPWDGGTTETCCAGPGALCAEDGVDAPKCCDGARSRLCRGTPGRCCIRVGFGCLPERPEECCSGRCDLDENQFIVCLDPPTSTAAPAGGR